MVLVHCPRCGILYESGDSIGVVMEINRNGGFVGEICSNCLDLNSNLKRGYQGWYVDWIAKRSHYKLKET